MTGIVKTKAKVITDNSGIAVVVPVLLIGDKVLVSLLDYALFHHHRKSYPWINRVVYACYLLLEYLEANKGLFSSPATLFLNFSQRLYSGTIGDDGRDPSGLFWLPKRTSNVNQLLTSLNQFTDWLEVNRNTQSINPLIEANSHEERLNYAAWFKKNNQQFLGHIKPTGLPALMKKVRAVQKKLDVIKQDTDAIAFSEKEFERFFEQGIGGGKDPRVCVRDQLILLLMHGCGVRESDALHLWVSDVAEGPNGVALVRLYHPEVGKAPGGWKGRRNQTNRSAYLKDKFGLSPRNRLGGTSRVGWKSRVVDHQDNYIQLYWFPSTLGQLFHRLWQVYLRMILPIDRSHPYAFISFCPRNLGSAYSLNAFNQNYKNALYRLGLVAAKCEGLTPHSHRHAYGRRLMRAGIDPLMRKKALHHASLASQTVYTQPGIKDVTEALERATERLGCSSDNPKATCYERERNMYPCYWEICSASGLI